MCCWLNVTRRGGGRREDGSLRFIGTISSISLVKVVILNVEHSCSINASESDTFSHQENISILHHDNVKQKCHFKMFYDIF